MGEWGCRQKGGALLQQPRRTLTHTHTHPPSRTGDHTQTHTSGHRTQGYKRKESFLPVGAVVTVVGELARNALAGTGGGARFVVRPPARGGDFVISAQTAPQLRAGIARLAFAYKAVAAAFGGLGAYLLARRALRRWLRARREARARRMLQAAKRAAEQRRAAAAAAAAAAGGDPAAAAAAAEAAAAGDDEGGGERDLDACVVCLEAQSTVAFTGCGHLCCCTRCVKSLKRCPVCRCASDTIRVFRM